MRTLTARIAGSILVSMLALEAWATETPRFDDGWTRLRIEAVHVLGGSRNLVPRWETDVRYAVVARDRAEVKRRVRTVLAEISSLTGVHVEPVNHPHTDADRYLAALERSPPFDLSACDDSVPPRCANLVVVSTYTGIVHEIVKALPLRPVFERATRRGRHVLCFFAPGVSAARRIERGFVFVEETLDEAMLDTCLTEELYQSFGLFNDYTDARYFSFDNRVAPKALTFFDKNLLASLYDRTLPFPALSERIVERMLERLPDAGASPPHPADQATRR